MKSNCPFRSYNKNNGGTFSEKKTTMKRGSELSNWRKRCQFVLILVGFKPVEPPQTMQNNIQTIAANNPCAPHAMISLTLAYSCRH